MTSDWHGHCPKSKAHRGDFTMVIASTTSTAREHLERIRARTAEHWQRHLANAGVLHLQVLGIREFGRHEGHHWIALIEELSNALLEQRQLIRERLAELN